MTVSTEVFKVQRAGNGSTFSFSGGDMEIFTDPDPSELEVYVDDGSGNVTQYTEGTGASNFSVSFTDATATKSTFTITLPADSSTALTSSDTVTIKPVAPLTQTVDLSNQGPYLAEVQEEAFDRLILIVQQQQENVDRTVRTNITEANLTDLEVPNTDATSADSVLGLSSDKTALEWKADAGTLPDPVTIARGGTGATTASAARTALGLALGSDAQAWDAQLDDIAALAVTDGNIIVGDGTNWVAESGATARASLGLTIGTNVQAWDDDLDDIAALTPANGDIMIGDGTDWTTATLYARTGQQRIFSSHAKVGATAGWVVNAADDLGLLATCPASQTSSTLVVPVSGLKVGDTITDFSVVGQIESAGNTVTLDANLRVLTAATADVTDASLDSITQISETADAIVSASKTLGSPHVVAADETFYVLLTATTAASTDIALQGVTVTVTEA